MSDSARMASPAAPKTRLLLVDDEARLTELLAMELAVEGYEVDVAADGATGLIRARSEPAPDLIVLDWNLPDFSGVDICQRIRISAITTCFSVSTGDVPKSQYKVSRPRGFRFCCHKILPTKSTAASVLLLKKT